MSVPKRQKCQFILSVDTEEEWDWKGPFPQKNFSVSNTERLPHFQAFCDNLGIRPTYFVDYAATQSDTALSVFKHVIAENKGEVAAHLHPWCNPPYFEYTDDYRSHVVNLPLDEVAQKLRALTQRIKESVGVKPLSFRTGRWGVNGEVLQLLLNEGYQVDSSVCPFYETASFSCQGALPRPYWPDMNRIVQAGTQRNIVEVPVSSGFNRRNFLFWGKLHRLLERSPYRNLRIIAALWHSGLLKKVFMSPELSQPQEMKELVNSTMGSGYKVVHMFLHSSTLLPGRNEFVKDEKDLDDFYGSIRKVIEHCRQKYDVEFCTVAEVAQSFRMHSPVNS